MLLATRLGPPLHQHHPLRRVAKVQPAKQLGRIRNSGSAQPVPGVNTIKSSLLEYLADEYGEEDGTDDEYRVASATGKGSTSSVSTTTYQVCAHARLPAHALWVPTTCPHEQTRAHVGPAVRLSKRLSAMCRQLPTRAWRDELVRRSTAQLEQ